MKTRHARAVLSLDRLGGVPDKVCTKADIPDNLMFHDIGRSVMMRDAEIATITGHSLKDVEAILDAHYLGWTTKLAVSAVAKLERAAAATGTDGEQKLENKVENGQTVPDAAGDK